MRSDRVALGFLVWSAAAGFASAQAPQYIISTYVGAAPSPTALAVSASLRSPQAVATDATGNLYIADFNRVQKVSSDRIITTVAGGGFPSYSGDGGPATSAHISINFGFYGFPGGLAIDSAGNLYIADSGNGRVRKVSPAGIITTVASSSPAGLNATR